VCARRAAEEEELPPPGGAVPRPYTVAALRELAVELAPALGGVADHRSHSACLRPSTRDGLPVLVSEQPASRRRRRGVCERE
jgi:glycine/D-amino acid oxidase-like deaminating enzyme